MIRSTLSNDAWGMVADSVNVSCKLGYSAKHRNYFYVDMVHNLQVSTSPRLLSQLTKKGELLVSPAWIRDFIQFILVYSANSIWISLFECNGIDAHINLLQSSCSLF